jgi:hypothetical protein
MDRTAIADTLTAARADERKRVLILAQRATPTARMRLRRAIELGAPDPARCPTGAGSPR